MAGSATKFGTYQTINPMPSLICLTGALMRRRHGAGGVLPAGEDIEDIEQNSRMDVLFMPEFCAVTEPVLKAAIPSEVRNMSSLKSLRAALKTKRKDADESCTAKGLVLKAAVPRKFAQTAAPTASSVQSGVEKIMVAMNKKALADPGAVVASKACLRLGGHMAGQASLCLRNLRGAKELAALVPVAPSAPKLKRPPSVRPGRHIRSVPK
mmetsp:Transcript_25834/g.53023  ORF Transcript_25834/g.53023 Transcript_25834/m.53023 type:complete len:210 (-) Transcript_25834:75-704(-)